MGEYIIRGGIRLSGEVEISGAKNAVLPVLAASVVTGDESVFLRCPEITDVESMLKILQSLGCRVKRDDDTISVDSSFLSEYRIPEDLMKEMRSGIFLAGCYQQSGRMQDRKQTCGYAYRRTEEDGGRCRV